MTRQEVKQTAPTPEDLYLADISPVPLPQWKEGKRFYVNDDRLGVLLIQRSLPADESLHPHRGDTLRYAGRREESHPDGTTTTAIVLKGPKCDYLFDTGRPVRDADQTFDSFSMEALTDLDALEAIRGRMMGQKYWTRTALWYDDDGDDFYGTKYKPVTVTAVSPGTMVFPVLVSFSYENNIQGHYLMSMSGHNTRASRRFASLFYLDDLKKKYPGIENEIWELICNGKVVRGMTKEECRLSLGSPIDSDSGRSYTSTLDIWKYAGGRYLKFEDGILVDFRQ